MSTRLQILVPAGLDRRIDKAAQRSRLSRSAWVRQAIERALEDDRIGGDALNQLGTLEGPTADIEEMIQEIESGRGR
jgi:metal-responsive CopG/Arc/MetJ family transcriptional regulator